MRVRLLRGQVVIREDLRADTRHFRHIIVPGVSNAERHDPDARQRARTWHRGNVLAMGAPMLTSKGVEVPHGFAVGDDVIFHWQHREKSWTRPWVDGELACWIPQAFVDAVIRCGDVWGEYTCELPPNHPTHHHHQTKDPRYGLVNW